MRCKECGKEFVKTGNNHKYCSKKCSEVVRGRRNSKNLKVKKYKRKWYSENQEKVKESLQRRKARRWAASIKLVVESNCVNCGKRFLKGFHQHRKKYCTPECGWRDRSIRYRQQLSLGYTKGQFSKITTLKPNNTPD